MSTSSSIVEGTEDMSRRHADDDEDAPIGERVAAVEAAVDVLRRDLDRTEAERDADHKRLTKLELGMARDITEIKTSLSTMAVAQTAMAKDWRDAVGDKREAKGRWWVIAGAFGLGLTLFGGFVAKVLWDAMTASKPVIASPPHSDAKNYARHCTEDAPWPCEPSR